MGTASAIVYQDCHPNPASVTEPVTVSRATSNSGRAITPRRDRDRYIPALRYDPLTSYFDPVVRLTTRERHFMQRSSERLKIVIPVTLALVIVLLYLNTRKAAKVAIVLLAVPFSLIGAFWLVWLLGYNLSVAVWVGIIALAGVDAETGVVMLLYLDQSYDRFKQEGRMRNLHDLEQAVEDGAVKRIRPKMMTVMAILLGLLPIMWSHGAGSDVMRRIAAPMVGGVITSFALELLIYAVIFTIWKGRRLKRGGGTDGESGNGAHPGGPLMTMGEH